MARITSGMRERRQVDPRVLQLKIRLDLPKGTPLDVALDLLEQSLDCRALVPPLRAIRWVDWRKGETGAIRSGHYDGPAWDELADFWAAITHPATRLKLGRPEE